MAWNWQYVDRDIQEIHLGTALDWNCLVTHIENKNTKNFRFTRRRWRPLKAWIDRKRTKATTLVKIKFSPWRDQKVSLNISVISSLSAKICKGSYSPYLPKLDQNGPIFVEASAEILPTFGRYSSSEEGLKLPKFALCLGPRITNLFWPKLCKQDNVIIDCLVIKNIISNRV